MTTDTAATELTFTAGARATLDLRDSAGPVTIKDWDGATIKVEAATTPFVLREQDTFRLTLPDGGVISLPIGLPAEVLTPPRVRVRVTRAGGETEVRPVEAAGASGGSAPTGAAPRDFTELADVMADYGRRIFKDVARTVRSSGVGVSEDVARKLDEASEHIEERARRAAERLQREVERTVASAERYESHGRRAAEHAEARARHVAGRVERHAERAARHAERGVRRGRGWFAERMDEWASAAGSAPPPRASEGERLAIMEMLRDGKITAEQAATLLDALGG